jgi:hypothetical protein
MTDRDTLVSDDPGPEVPDVPKAKRYEMVKMGPSGTFRMATTAWSDRLTYLFRKHVKHDEPQYGWKGPCRAVVPEHLAADVREAMGHVGAIVDLEEATPSGMYVALYSEGYYIHIGA